MKQVSYIKDPDSGKTYRVVPEPVIFGRAIPRYNARPGSRYLFTDAIRIKGFDFDEDQFVSELWMFSRSESGSIYKASEMSEFHHCIVTIPDNFDCDRFLSDESYAKSCITSSMYYTGPTTSPYYEYRNGDLICIKPNLAHINQEHKCRWHDEWASDIILPLNHHAYCVRRWRKGQDSGPDTIKKTKKMEP